MRALAGGVVHQGFFSTRAGPKGDLEEVPCHNKIKNFNFNFNFFLKKNDITVKGFIALIEIFSGSVSFSTPLPPPKKSNLPELTAHLNKKKSNV